MSLLFGGGSKVKPQYTGLQVQTSSKSLPIPLLWGMNRLAPNLIWYGDFKAHKKKQKAGKGAPKQTYYEYTASVAMALCHGVIGGIPRVFRDNEKHTSYAALGLSLFTGTNPQAPWGYLVSKHPDEALGYPNIAYLAAANYDLGTSARLPAHSFEVQGPLYATGNAKGDALPPDIIVDFLCNPDNGCGFDESVIDEESFRSGPDATTTGDSSYETYCRAMGFAMSPLLVSEEEAGTILTRWMELTNSEVIWTGYNLKFVPYGDKEVTGNGYHYVPETKVIRYSLSDNDYVSRPGSDPVEVERRDPADAHSSLKLEFRNRADEYNEVPAEWKDQGLIDQFGLRPAPTLKAHEICEPDIASKIVGLVGARKAYLRNEYTFVLPPSFVLLEPGDLVECYDPELGLVAVMIESIEEDEDGNFDCSGREFKSSVTTANEDTYITQPTDSGGVNSAADPGPVNAPILFEPPSAISNVPQVWAAVSGGDGNVANENWGGCIVFVSTDNVTFDAIGQIEEPARMGVLTAAFPDYAGENPDTTSDLMVSLTMSAGELMGTDALNAADGATLSIVKTAAGTYELIGFQDATLTGTNTYTLENLWRGLHRTDISAAAIGDQFARLDDALFKYDLPPEYIGRTLYFKFQSFNVWSASYQDLSTCAVYTYTPEGIGFGVAPSAPESVVATSGGILSNKITWAAPASGDPPDGYRIYGAEGSAIPFEGTTAIGAVQGVTEWTHSGLDVSETWTYYIVAYNGGGDGPPSLPVEATTSSAGGGSGGGGGGGGSEVLLEEHVLEAPAASVEIDLSLYSAYDHVVIEVYGRSDGTGATVVNLDVQFNGDTGANYNGVNLYATGSGANGGDSQGANQIPVGVLNSAASTESEFSWNFNRVLIPFYGNNTSWKRAVSVVPAAGEISTSDHRLYNYVGIWENTAPITSISVKPREGDFIAGSIIKVIGVKVSESGGGGGGGWQPTPPVAADFSVIRNYSGIGAPSIADAMRGVGVIATFPRNTTGSSWEQSYLFKPSPIGLTWRFECLMYNMAQTNDNYWFNGIGVGSTAVGTKHFAIQTFLNGSTDVRYGRVGTYPSLNGNTTSDYVLDEGAGEYATSAPPVWYAIEYDATGPLPVLNFLWSLDGYGWVQSYHVDDPATWLGGAVDLIGFAHMSVATSGGDNTVRCSHFKETTNLADPLGLNTS